MTNIIAIQDIAEVNPKIDGSISSQKKRDVTFLPMAAVSETGVYNFQEKRKLEDVIKGFTYFQEGDILLAKITPCMENGKAVHACNLLHPIGFGSTEFHVIRPSREIDGRYLFYMVWNPYFRQIAEKNMTGSAGQKRVPVDFIRRFKIPLPPLPEQKRIAAILDKADAVRRKRQETIRLVDEFLRSVFLEMFGDPESNPRGWNSLSMGEIVDEFRYGTSNKANWDGYPVLRIPNVIEGSINLTDLKYCPVTNKEYEKLKLIPSDLLFVRTNGNADYVGRSAVIDDSLNGYIYASYLIRARLKDSSNAGIYLILDTSTGNQYIGSAYGEQGIWGRWSNYLTDGSGGNKKLLELIKDNESYKDNFQFSLLKTLPTSMLKKDVVNQERIFKEKLGSKAFGLNSN